jgi:translation initiation factor eIF-2B subunit alpha
LFSLRLLFFGVLLDSLATMTSTTDSTMLTAAMVEDPVSNLEGDLPLVLQDLRRFLSRRNSGLDDKSAIAMPVAGIQALLGVVQRSRSETMMGLQDELKQAAELMMEYSRQHLSRSHIALASGCELFLKYITRTFLEIPDFEACRQQVLERGERFADVSLAARDRIATSGHAFVRDGSTVLLHGWSRVVAALLLKAAETKHFDVVCLEGRPDAAGVKAAQVYAKAGIPTKVVLDSAMGYIMESVDMVLVGAEGVVENGGIVNKMGTYALAMCAKECGKSFYVAAESYKFARLYPLNQRDLPTNLEGLQQLDFVDTASWHRTEPSSNTSSVTAGEPGVKIPGMVSLPSSAQIENPSCDFTPAKFITLLFTDLGVLTPSAVSDELIKLYQ